jgi:hypothetical protein
MTIEIPVSVDRDFARFGSKTYAINKINSVDVRYRYPYSQAGILVWGLVAIICGVSAISWASDGFGGKAIVALLLTALSGFLAYRARQRSRIKEYQLFLMTSSSEAQAIASRDQGFIANLRNQIERAMAGKLPN